MHAKDQLMGKLVNVYPRSPIMGEQEFVGTKDYNEAGVLQELRDLTLFDPPIGVVVAGHFNTEGQDPRWLDFLERLELKPVSLEYVIELVAQNWKRSVEVPAKKHRSKVVRNARAKVGGIIRREIIYGFEEAHTEERVVYRRVDFSDKWGLNLLIENCKEQDDESLPIKAVVFFCNEDDGELKFLPKFRECCPEVDVYIFHDQFCKQYGVVVESDPSNWEEQFPVMGECELPQPEVIVDRFLNKGSINVFAGRFETYKTMALIELCSAILDNRKVFDEFAVLHQHPILFLEQDMSPELFQDYARPFGLMKQQDFRWQRPGGDIFTVVDPVLQRAVQGRILILDTMLDYAQIEKAADSGEWIKFMQQLRELITIHGCIAIIMTAHATKTGAKATTIDPSEYFKDSATFGGKVDVGYGFKPLDGTCQVQIERIKQRGFKKGLVFTIAVNDDDGDSNLSKGRFPVHQKPGAVKKLKGRPAKRDPEMVEKIKARRAEGKSNREIADELVDVSEATVRRILKEETFDFTKE
jgi:hypothetical protein